MPDFSIESMQKTKTLNENALRICSFSYQTVLFWKNLVRPEIPVSLSVKYQKNTRVNKYLNKMAEKPHSIF